MRLLLLSDTHGDFSVVERILLSQPTAEAVLFAGDGCREIEDARCLHPERMFCAVRGNCDWNVDAPLTRLETFEGLRILLLHGQGHQPGHDSEELYRLAGEQNARVVVYGHTHVADISYRNGVYLLNPGSARCPRDGMEPSYMLLDLLPSGLLPAIVRLRP